MTDEAVSLRLIDQRPFVLFWCSRVAATLGYHMMAVTIGWTVYALTGNAYDLGLVGLIQFIPAVVFTLLIGHVADRYDRRHIVRLAQATHAVAAIIVFAGLYTNSITREWLFVAVFLIGTARAFELPSGHSLVPSTVAQPLIPRAIAAWSSANQAAVICGPAAGGLLYAYSPMLVCALCVVLFVVAMTLVTFVKVERAPAPKEPVTLASVFAGFHYIRNRQRLLGVITLDLFVVLLGGVTALLPIYAHDILDAGPAGLGLLRSAPAIGALITTITMSWKPIQRHVGIAMFMVVAIYGVSTMVFALSTWLPLS
ncbi:MAG: MFS transporter, partial [Pseudolabrys sp.]|nr:MFS transporter [Pseudolabrys sp.]